MHADYTLLMSLVLDDEATPTEEGRLREHLRACGACAGVWTRWQAMDYRLAAVPFVAPPANLVDTVMAQVEARELRRRRARWLGSGLLVSWLAVALISLGIIATLVVLGTRHPGEAKMVFSGALQFLTGMSWLLIGLVTFMRGLGAPAIAAGVGVWATLTCMLGMAWLWVIGRSHIWFGQPLQVIR
jgi:predicted anti-sigma-YlaC factor YlaD